MRNFFKFRFAGTLIILVMIAIFGVAVMLLWNALLPGLFELPVLNYWQAVGILLLVRILSGGLGHNFDYRYGNRNGSNFHGQTNELREKWMNMSDDERKEFFEKRKDSFNFDNRFAHFHDFFEKGKKKEKEVNE